MRRVEFNLSPFAFEPVFQTSMITPMTSVIDPHPTSSASADYAGQAFSILILQA